MTRKDLVPTTEWPDKELARSETEAELQAALVERQRLRTLAEEYDRAMRRVNEARSQLEELKQRLPADLSVASLEAEEGEADEEIRRLEHALAMAQERRRQVRHQLDYARRVQSELERLGRIVAEEPEPVSPEQLAEAEQRVAEACKRHERAIKAQRARHLAEQADQHRQAAAAKEGPR